MTSHVIAYRSFELLLGTHTFNFNCFFEDFNCVFTQIRCLSRVLGYYEEHLCDITLNLACGSGGDAILRYFLSRVLVALLFAGAEPSVQPDRGPYEEHFCKIIKIWTNGSEGNAV